MTDSQRPTENYASLSAPLQPSPGQSQPAYTADKPQAPVQPKRSWYTKKRFLVPIVGVLVVGWIGSLGDDGIEQVGSTKSAAIEATQSVEETEAEEEATVAAEAEHEAAQAEQDAAEAVEKEKAAEEAAVAAEEAAAAEAAAAAENAAAAEAVAAAEAAAEEAARGTVAQQNALRSSESYLDYSAFSRTGLIGQLEFEGFSTEDATWGVDRSSVDWNVQAAASAKSYLDYSSFSRSGLVNQLVFEGFTSEQAEYGVSQTGL